MCAPKYIASKFVLMQEYLNEDEKKWIKPMPVIYY
jgi:hypothetical protein